MAFRFCNTLSKKYTHEFDALGAEAELVPAKWLGADAELVPAKWLGADAKLVSAKGVG